MKNKLDISPQFDFDYFLLLKCGLQLGGNIKPNHLRNSSIVYAKKNKNFIVKISLTSLQLKKIIKLMARYLRRNATLYFIHSHFGFKLLMKQLFAKTSVFFLTRRKKKKSIYIYNRLKQLKNVFFIGYWQPGYITNRNNFFETRQKKKLITKYPKFGFINDYKVNFISLKEFRFSQIPYSSMVNLNVSKTSHGMFNIPGNAMSFDSYISI